MVGFHEEVAEIVPSVFGVEGLWIFSKWIYICMIFFLGISMTSGEYGRSCCFAREGKVGVGVGVRGLRICVEGKGGKGGKGVGGGEGKSFTLYGSILVSGG